MRRLRENRPEVEIEQFYSDSMNDLPLAKLARSAYMVKGDERKPFPIA